MKTIKMLLFLLLALAAGKTFAQIPDPTSWTYEVKKRGADKYDLIFHLTLKDGWHIWSLKPGGDGLEIAPSFSFNDSTAIPFDGQIKEVGTPKTVAMEGIDGKVTYFNGKVDYVQRVTIKGKAKITGTHLYQICNDNVCLPPKTKDFTFLIE